MPAEGLQSSHVEEIRQQVDRAIIDTLNTLRKVEVTAQQRLREATIERQKLDVFVEELHYRVRFLTEHIEGGTPPITITGPLTEDQLQMMEHQAGELDIR